LCQVLGWSIHGGLNVSFLATQGEFSPRVFVIFAWGALAAMVCTHGLRAWVRRRGWLNFSPLRALPRVFGASLVTGTVISGIMTAAWPVVFGAGALARSGTSWIYPAVFQWSVSVFMWAILYFGIHYFESFESAKVKGLNLEVVAKDAQLRA